ncbi:MAG: hypothetical protein KAH48_06170, partial [Chlorobi bacterium]|nr:hypothetical protein [Chlorobiota bacterium]
DLTMSLESSFMSTSRSTFNMDDYEDEDGQKLDGSTKFMIEPRIRYSMSDRITAAFFVRYENTTSEGAASPGFSTLQIGFDFRMSIAGGR